MGKRTEDLIELVEALTPTEKQQFKRRHDPASEFIVMFDFVNKHGVASGPALSRWMERKAGHRKSFSPGHLSSLRKYLMERILESLRMQHGHDRTHELMSRCMNTDLLLEKGLYGLAGQQIVTARKGFFEGSFPIDKLLLLRRWSILQFYQNYEGTTQRDIDKLYAERIEYAEQVLLQIKYARILTQLSYQYFKRMADPQLLRQFMDEPFMNDPSLATEFETRYLYHWIHAQFAELSDEPQTAILHFEKALSEWMRAPKYIETHPRMYLGTCFTYLKYRLQQANPYDQIIDQHAFSDMLKLLPNAGFSQDVTEQYATLFQAGRLVEFRKHGEYHRILEIEADLLTSGSKSSGFIPELIKYIVAVAHFATGSYDLADNHLSHLADLVQRGAAQNPENHNLIVSLLLVNQFSMGNDRYLRHLLDRYREISRSKPGFGEFSQLIVRMFRELLSERFKDSHDRVYDRYIARLKRQILDLNLAGHPEYQLFVDWIEGQRLKVS